MVCRRYYSNGIKLKYHIQVPREAKMGKHGISSAYRTLLTLITGSITPDKRNHPRMYILLRDRYGTHRR